MAHPVSNATQAPKVQQAQEVPKTPAPKQAGTSAPEDKVTISTAGRSAQGSGHKSGGKK